MTLSNTIIAGNSAPNRPDLSDGYYGGYFYSDGTVTASYSLIGNDDGSDIAAGNGNVLDPAYVGLRALGDNGGATQTMALLPGSDAIGAGDPGQAGTTAQNGVVRPAAPDIGAYQTGTVAPVVTPNTAPIPGDTTAIGIGGLGFDPNVANDSITLSNGVTGSVYFASATTLDFTVTGLNNVPAGTALYATVTVDGQSSGGPVQIGTVTGTGVDWIVTDPNGNAGSGSPTDVTLPYAVANAQNGDSITFANDLSGDTIILNSTLIIDHNFTITGLVDPLAVSGNYSVEVFDVPSGVTTSISDLIIENGYASSGGGVHNEGTLTLTGDILSGNTAYGYGGSGGGISNDYGSLTVCGSTLSGNSAIDGNGSAIFNNYGSLTVSSSTFSDNYAEDRAGGIYNHGGTAMVSNSTFSSNSGIYGGAIFNGGISFPGVMTVSNCTFSGNSASNFGGGIVNYGTLTLNNCTLSNNYAESSGGGIWNVGSLIVSNSTISANSAGYAGGGINAYLSTMTLSNTIIAGNGAS